MGLTKVTRGVIEPFENYDVNNINATGIVTATSFDGNVTGNISGGTVAGSTGTFTGDVDIADKIVHTGDTNTAIRFPANNTFTVETAGSERVRVDSSGDVGIGASSPSTKLHVDGNILSGADSTPEVTSANYQGTQVTSSFQVYSEINKGSTISLVNARSNTQGSPSVILNKANGDLTTPLAISNTQTIGSLVFNGFDGTNYINAAHVRSTVDGTVGTNSMPGNLSFWTSPAASATPVERMRINSDGKIGIGTDSPTEKLHVLGDARITGILTVGTASITIDGDAGTVTATTFAGTATNLSDAANITTGTLADARIPSLDASKITSGSFGTARIPSLDASKITSGSFADARIPNLSTSKITSGAFADARIPNLNASKITGGTFSSARIPNLSAAKITSGTLNVNITASRVTDEIATSTAGTKGSYAFLGQTTNTARSPNYTVAGSSLLYSNANGPESGAPGGSWRLMGRLGAGEDPEKASVWVRYA